MAKFKLILLLIGAIMIAVGTFYVLPVIKNVLIVPTPSKLEKGLSLLPENRLDSENTEAAQNIEVVADNLEIPWEIAFLPDGDMLVTERPGRLVRINGSKRQSIEVPDVTHVEEAGLLGIAVHPRFEHNKFVYLYTTFEIDDRLKNKVERFKLTSDKLVRDKVIVDDIPGAIYHDGGRMAFGPDGYLYITTGDAGAPDSAQDLDSLAGKILRVKDDGSIPSENPFDNAIYSYGHRNSQGIAWDGIGNLWATEHGRSGVLSGMDEINLITIGKNYGWPLIEGSKSKNDMLSPVVNSGANETWAPAGMTYIQNDPNTTDAPIGSLFFAGLRGESLYEARINGDSIVSLRSHFRSSLGRLRAVALGPDGFIYISTSNRDGRGNGRVNDDKVIRINTKIFR